MESQAGWSINPDPVGWCTLGEYRLCQRPGMAVILPRRWAFRGHPAVHFWPQGTRVQAFSAPDTQRNGAEQSGRFLRVSFHPGLFPELYFSLVNNIILNIYPAALPVQAPFIHSFAGSLSLVGKYAMLFIVLSILVYLARNRFTRRHPAVKNLTWGCGYPAPTSRMQYTGKSFSKSLGKLLNFAVLERKQYKEISPAEIFPAGRKYSSHYNDFFVVKIFNGVISRLLYSLNYFQFIQNGKIQMYILYGVFFIVLIFLGSIFNII